jgi:UDP-glucose 4-epimerase
MTGGVGFTGYHLIEELLKHRYRLTALDELSTGKLENVRPLIEPSWHYIHLFLSLQASIQSRRGNPWDCFG